MHEQLLLLLPADDRPWRLDEHTREIGRRGIEEARAALRQAVPRADGSAAAPAASLAAASLAAASLAAAGRLTANGRPTSRRTAA